ncbi:MAG TPA: hypothetical protein VNT60_03515 [Deinococcales bacterium]|nr:hypothetical protein [Deinococcales bacterium]
MPEKIVVTRQEDVPDFDAMTREQEADWWDTHDLADHLWRALTPAEELAFAQLLPPRSEDPGDDEGDGKRAAA